MGVFTLTSNGFFEFFSGKKKSKNVIPKYIVGGCVQFSCINVYIQSVWKKSSTKILHPFNNGVLVVLENWLYVSKEWVNDT